MEKKKYKLIVVDDHKLFRDGLKFVINQIDNLEVVAEASTGVEFLNILENHQVDLVLMDISMPELDGIQATQQATEKYPGIKILVISMFCDEEYYYQMGFVFGHFLVANSFILVNIYNWSFTKLVYLF
jgi:DNA-binding NarL/FixJ family response regulator